MVWPIWTKILLGLFTVFFLWISLAIGRVAFKYWVWRKNLENIPTSPIATAPVGSHVELKGDILHYPTGKKKLAPFSKTPCSYFFLEHIVNPSGHGGKKIFRFFPEDFIFLNDGSGACALIQLKDTGWSPEGNQPGTFQIQNPLLLENLYLLAAQFPSKKWTITARELKKAFPKIYKEYMHQVFNVMDIENQEAELWFRERIIEPEETVYVFGYADSIPHLIYRLDKNKDGTLSEDEIERGRKLIGKKYGIGPAPEILKDWLAKSKVAMHFTKKQPLVIAKSEAQAKTYFFKRALGYSCVSLVIFVCTIALIATYIDHMDFFEQKSIEIQRGR